MSNKIIIIMSNDCLDRDPRLQDKTGIASLTNRNSYIGQEYLPMLISIEIPFVVLVWEATLKSRRQESSDVEHSGSSHP